jgi:natural product precursor
MIVGLLTIYYFLYMKNFDSLKKNALSKEQMGAVKGGVGTCGYLSPSGTVGCGVYKHQAQHMATADGYWCCDSCHLTKYCG